ncbi:cation diffusion facilitator family transporter [Methanobrevibacter sp.]|uniref:cation diffusion facilitator family transporter n=1 Tax=Methanobrevibacter sp. TaxID=66852 RepID=UPI003891130F
MDEYRNKEGNKAVIAAILSNFILTTLNITVGYMSGSYALIAEGFHTLSDIITTIIAYIGFKLAQKPSDKMHPMGHGRIEAIAGLLILLFLTLVGGGIIHEAIEKLLDPTLIRVPNHHAALIALFGVFLNLIISIYIIKIGRKINSPAIEADGLHQRTDIFSSISIIIGVIASNLGYPKLDPIIGLVIGLIILKTAYDIGTANIDSILGKVPPEVIKKIEQVANSTPNAYEAHNIKVDNYGPYFIVFLHVKVDGNLSVDEAHKIIHNVEENILKIDKIKYASVHACPIGLEYEHEQETND